MAPGVLGRNIKADNAFMTSHQSTAVSTSDARASRSACLCTPTRTPANVTKRSHVLVSVVSTAWPPPTGPAHRCHSVLTRASASLRGKERRALGRGDFPAPTAFPVPFISEKNPKTFLFLHNLSALLIIRPPLGFVRTFVLFATIFGRLFFRPLALPVGSYVPDNLTTID